jgi:2-hydroxychromene-2-carboxylate isomerase
LPRLEFHFDYRSPYSYLAFTQLPALGVDASFHPFDLRDLMLRVENVPTSVVCKPKNRYVRADLLRWAQHYGVPFERNPQAAEIDGRRLLRATLAAADFAGMEAAIRALYFALWAKPEPLKRPEDVANVLSAAGLNGAEIARRAEAADIEQTLDQSTAKAADRGVFGAPTFFLGDEMFFGNDRLAFIRERLGVAA